MEADPKMSRLRWPGSSLNSGKREMILNRFVPADGRNFQYAAWGVVLPVLVAITQNHTLKAALCCFPKRHRIVSAPSLTRFRIRGLILAATTRSLTMGSIQALVDVQRQRLSF